MPMNKRLYSILTILAAYGILELLSLVKINILLGAKTALFSGFSVGGPLVGLYTGMGFGAGLFFIRRLIHCITLGTSLISPFSLYVPTLAAGWYFKSTSWLIRVVVPVICMALFIAHPVGGQAWFYAMYWLIPVALCALSTRSAFTEALGATFVQHAVGSVLWLYLVPTTTAVWVSLMPLVLVERLVCASAMVGIIYAVAYVRSFITQSVQPQSQRAKI